jgi:hypothetical protein
VKRWEGDRKDLPTTPAPAQETTQIDSNPVVRVGVFYEKAKQAK